MWEEREKYLILFSAYRAVGVGVYRDASECHGQEVEGEEGVVKPFADGEDVFEGFGGLDGADDAGKGPRGPAGTVR